MANTKTLRLSVGALFTKGPGKIYFYRYRDDTDSERKYFIGMRKLMLFG